MHKFLPNKEIAKRFSPTKLKNFISSEASGGLILMAVAAIALIVANSPFSPVYFSILSLKIAGMSVHHWINDGLMALFFLLIGLEVKRELLEGELSTWPARLLPGFAALAGMIFPALIYAGMNWNSIGLRGWAIPAATDIAFALGVLALLGSRVPLSLKVFLTAVAIIDDLGAIIIIALFYTNEIVLVYLALALLGLFILTALNKSGIKLLSPYLLIGAGIWWFLLQSGVHATLAGVAVALTIPLSQNGSEEKSALYKLEHAIYPWIAFAVIPIFGFTNAGVSFTGLNFTDAFGTIPLGITLGLFLGKQLGIFSAVWIAVKLGYANLPDQSNWWQIYGVAILCGIGFTMSLFIGELSFGNHAHLTDTVKIGIFSGSFLSAIIGWIILRITSNNHKNIANNPTYLR
ncbi:MAG: Na+/H+ antiporter NhaA [Alphaproteobacteria bacterium]|nr:Na+/H+ antiporter NhaA [Alphaproteobacteria bacterium]